MKKLFLLMALVLTAGVVHAQNFGNRAKLTKAKRANSRVSGPKTFSWSANNQYYSENGQVVNLFNNVQNSDNIPSGKTMAQTYENFVIRVSGLTSDSPYSVEFYDLEYDNGKEKEVLLHTFTYWKDDVHISPLRSLFSEQDINRIHRVKLKSSCSSGRLIFEEAYFISALPALDFTDKDDIDIGNAYIDPSYLIRSNRLWVDINETDRSFYIKMEPGNEGEVGTLSFSLPYRTGIDMTDVTFTATDFLRTADVLSRCIYENKRRDLQHNPKTNAFKAKDRDQLVRDLYNSRYNGPFYDQLGQNAINLDANDCDRDPNQIDNDLISSSFPLTRISDKAIKHVNSIYWQSVGAATTETRSIWCQDICFTKNTIKARKTRKELDPTMWPMHDDEQGFRNKDYPVRPYDNRNTPTNDWSDVVRGDWNADYGNDPRYWNCADFSRYNKMRITGSPNTSLDIRFSTKASVNEISSPDDLKVIVVKTDAHGEVNVDLGNYEHFLLHAILFHDDKNNKLGLSRVIDDIKGDGQGGLRDKLWVDDVELFEGEGREVDLVGSPNPNDPNITANMFHIWNNDDNYKWQYGTIVRWTDSGFKSNIGDLGSGDLLYGNGNVDVDKYADLTGYKAIRVYGQGSFRISYNRQDYVPNSCPQIDITSNGTYAELDISNFEYFHLNSIKVPYGQSSHVDYIKLVENEEADYVLYGNGSCFEQNRAAIDPSVEKAVGDATAKVIDARARCNNMEVPFDYATFGEVQQTRMPQTANPNVLYIERTNQFESRKVGEHEQQKVENDEPVFENGEPVMETVEDYDRVNFITPSNLQYNADGSSEYFTSGKHDTKYDIWYGIKLTDGYSFYAPKEIRAVNATYTRTFKNTKPAVNSIILPFAVDAGDNETYGFYETNVTLKSTTNEGKVGILKDEDVNEGDWLLQFTKKTGTTKPNTPYLYAVASGGEVVFNGEGETVIIPETPNVQVPAHKNMTNNLPNAENPTYDFYLRGVYEGTYMEHILFYGADGTFYRTPFMTVTPFRTIIKSPIAVIEDDNETENDEWKDSQTNYFTPANGVKVVLAFNPHDDSSDINEVVADGLFAEDEPIYNVAGQRVNTFGKGIYIVGGKKILVK